MYRAISLSNRDKDFHRFLWRDENNSIRDYRMNRLTFGVAGSSFAANMAVFQNAKDHQSLYPKAAEVVHSSFYVDDCLTGATTVSDAIKLREDLQELFSKGQFDLRKWNSSSIDVLKAIPVDLRDSEEVMSLDDQSLAITKTLGVQWYTREDVFNYKQIRIRHSNDKKNSPI